MSAQAIRSEDLPIYARRNDEGLYTWEGIKYPSVTTVIQLFGGDHLIPWAAKMTAVECAEITQRRLDGHLTLEESDAMILSWSDRMTCHIRHRDHAGRRGSLVHHGIYEWAMGVRDMISDPQDYLLHWVDKLCLVDPYRSEEDNGSYAIQLAKEARHYLSNALTFIQGEDVEFEAIGQEAVVVNEEHGFAGQTDAIVKHQRRRKVWDFKNTKSKQERKWQLQVEAYRHAEFIGLVATGEKFATPETEGAAILWIKPVDACELIELDPRDDYWEAFLAMRQAYGVLHDLPKPNTKPRSAKPEKRDRYTAGF